MSLWLGENPYEPAFESDDARRAAWFKHRDHLLAVCCDHPGGRPDGWWSYESPIPRPKDDNYCAAALWEIELFDDEERRALEATWREYFDAAQSLEGTAAKRARYAWAGIPKALIRKWRAERRRSTKTIHNLAGEAQEPASSVT